jgi:hypothetical protein
MYLNLEVMDGDAGMLRDSKAYIPSRITWRDRVGRPAVDVVGVIMKRAVHRSVLCS